MKGSVIISIIIPCYNQPEILNRCLGSIRNQTYKDFEIIIVDDCSDVSYSEVISRNDDLPVKYERNIGNLGAVPNMIQCLKYAVNGMFKVVFHEDDVMYPNFLEDGVIALRESGAGWAGANMSFFMSEPTFEEQKKDVNFICKNQVKVLAEFILAGRSLSFASVMYRNEIVEDAYFDLERYSMLGDRPLLLNLAKKYGCVYLNYNLVAAQNHSSSDNRWQLLRQRHILNYYAYLRGFFNKIELKNKRIKSGFTWGVLDNFKLLPADHQHNKAKFLCTAYLKRILSVKYLLLYNRRVRKTVDVFKYYNRR